MQYRQNYACVEIVFFALMVYVLVNILEVFVFVTLHDVLITRLW